MSAIVAVNCNGNVVLAADSRETSCDGSFSDTTEKIFEVAPGVFCAMAGTRGLMSEQLAIVTQLARTADLTNPQGLADQIDEASRAAFDRKIARTMELRSRFHFMEEEATGERPFHTYLLAWVRNGQPGFICRSFTLEDGKVVPTEWCYFDMPEGYLSRVTVGGPLIKHLTEDPTIWSQGLLPGCERLLQGLREATPYVGGPSQVLALTKDGAMWINRLANPQTIYSDANHALNVKVDGSSVQVVGNQLVLGTTPLASILTALASASTGAWTYAGKLGVDQLVVGLGTAYFASTATFGSVNASGPCVQIGAAGAVFKDNLTTPVNTVTVNSSGVNITGGSTSGLTIQDATATNKLVLNASTGITITGGGASGITLQNASNNSRLVILPGQVNFYGGNVLCMEIAASGLQLYTPGGVAVVTINSSGLAIGSGATITSPSISGGSINGSSLSIATTGSNGTVTINSGSQGINVNYGSLNTYITAAGHSATSGLSVANMIASQISVVNGLGAGCYMNQAGYFSVAISSTTYNGATFTFLDQGGATHVVKGGILIS